MTLVETLGRIRGQEAPGRARAVERRVVMPLLRELGWDELDPSEVDVEREDVGLALCVSGAVVFVEAVDGGRAMMGRAGELLEAAVAAGAEMVVVANGAQWLLFLVGGAGGAEGAEGRRFATVELRSDDGQAAVLLERYLSRAALVDGSALSAAEAALVSLPRAWRRLLSGPDELLVELLQDAAAAESGARPSGEEAAAFLRGLEEDGAGLGASGREDMALAGSRSSSRRPGPRPKPPLKSGRGKGEAAAQKVGVVVLWCVRRGYRLWGEEHVFTTWKGFWCDTAERVYGRHGSEFGERVGDWSTGRAQRPHVTQRPERLRSPWQIPGSGWYIEVNLSGAQCERIVREFLGVFGYGSGELELIGG